MCSLAEWVKARDFQSKGPRFESRLRQPGPHMTSGDLVPSGPSG